MAVFQEGDVGFEQAARGDFRADVLLVGGRPLAGGRIAAHEDHPTCGVAAPLGLANEREIGGAVGGKSHAHTQVGAVGAAEVGLEGVFRVVVRAVLVAEQPFVAVLDHEGVVVEGVLVAFPVEGVDLQTGPDAAHALFVEDAQTVVVVIAAGEGDDATVGKLASDIGQSARGRPGLSVVGRGALLPFVVGVGGAGGAQDLAAGEGAVDVADLTPLGDIFAGGGQVELAGKHGGDSFSQRQASSAERSR